MNRSDLRRFSDRSCHGRLFEAERRVQGPAGFPGGLVGHGVGAAEEFEVVVAGEPFVDDGFLRAVTEPSGV